MRSLAVCAVLALGVGCAQVQTRTHYDRWLAKNDATPARVEGGSASAAPAPTPAPAPRTVRETAAPAARPMRSAAPEPMPRGDDTPAIERNREPTRRSRVLRPVENEEEEEEAIY